MNINITKNRAIWFTISGIMVGLSLLAIFLFGFRLGLDFTGGARWDIRFENPPSPQALQEFFASQPALTKSVQITPSENNTYFITIEDLPDKQIQTIKKNLKDTFGNFEEISYRKVDANIGASFKTKSLYAITAALIAIVLFIAFAFRKVPKAINPWRFGGVALIALFHDIIIVTGIFVVLGYFWDVELDLAFITALLATLGFSVNDTIVILDRVRENIRKQKPHESFEDTVEKSIKQTLRRSINTSFSTLLPLLSLLFFGADAIFYFVLALTLGIIVGTYSSIFLAAPLLVTWKKLASS